MHQYSGMGSLRGEVFEDAGDFLRLARQEEPLEEGAKGAVDGVALQVKAVRVRLQHLHVELLRVAQELPQHRLRPPPETLRYKSHSRSREAAREVPVPTPTSSRIAAYILLEFRTWSRGCDV
eukprot:1194472-Prorocentrum_minimum.AAC.1